MSKNANDKSMKVITGLTHAGATSMAEPKSINGVVGINAVST